ncbi:MAG: biopolymer transporter ExbD [Planctomycetota bacterium]|nr:biopolymer transporter ExbD [Planctomycetota bacterium]
MSGGGFGEGDASFDLTPMIDVMLLLIVFFMMSSQFSRSEQLSLELPRERGDRALDETRPAEVILDMTRDGALHVRGDAVSYEELAEVLGAGRASGTVAPIVVVRADRAARAEHLNRLALELSKLGIASWKLGTVPEGSAPAGGATGGDGR